MASILSLEELCISTYLKYLEHECAAYVSLTQSESVILKNIAPKMMSMMKTYLSNKIGNNGVTSTVIRQRMLELVLSDRFPSPKYSNVYIHKRTAKDVIADAPETLEGPQQQHILGAYSEFMEETEHLYSNCSNSCCTGSFIKETMAGVIMSPEIKELIFTNDTVGFRKSSVFPQLYDFDSPVVLTHLLYVTHHNFSQLEKLVFSEHFVKEEPNSITGLSPGEDDTITKLRLLQVQHPTRILDAQRQRQARFVRKFAEGNSFYASSDRRGLVLDLLVMFRDVAPKSHNAIGFYKLNVLVLKNNIQCELYSKANFQFELLARIGFCCPKLKVLDIFGTDTWADCLVALFFRDAFHSLHRYLFFMEDENDEQSAYHPHDLTKYCQFCLDKLHPITVERPFTVNPIIPLIDPIYDHVIRKYPKRSFCILRNCIRVSDLIQSTQSSVFELQRSNVCEEAEGICSRLRSRKRKITQNQPRQKIKIKRKSKCESKTDQAEAFKTKSDDIDSLHGMMYRSKINPHDTSNETANDEPKTKLNRRRSSRISYSVMKAKKCQKFPPKNSSNKIVNRFHGKEEEEEAETETEEEEIQASPFPQPPPMDAVTFKDWQHETSQTLKSQPGGDPVSAKCPDSNGEMCTGCLTFYTGVDQDPLEMYGKTNQKDYSCIASGPSTSSDPVWVPPDSIKYREIKGWPHLNDCINSLEILNIGGTNVLGEFIPFILLHAKNLKSLGQWINTMVYGLEILRALPGHQNSTFPNIQEFSYSTDRNYFCQPYIGFVPETKEYRNVRKEMVKQSARVAKRLSQSIRHNGQKQKQIAQDVALMTSTCPNVKKLNLMLHHKMIVMDPEYTQPWNKLRDWTHLIELDLVSMRFANIQSLLKVVGPKLESLTLEIDEEQGKGSELVFMARNCPNLKKIRILIGDKTLMGESNLCYDLPFFRKVERLTVEGAVHLHAFVFLWGHCKALKYLKMGSVVSNNGTNTNVLVYEVFTLLLQVNKMAHLEEMHIKNLKIRSLHMGLLLLDHLNQLKKASTFLLDIYGQDLILFKQKLTLLKQKQGLVLDYKEW